MTAAWDAPLTVVIDVSWPRIAVVAVVVVFAAFAAWWERRPPATRNVAWCELRPGDVIYLHRDEWTVTRQTVDLSDRITVWADRDDGVTLRAARAGDDPVRVLTDPHRET